MTRRSATSRHRDLRARQALLGLPELPVRLGQQGRKALWVFPDLLVRRACRGLWVLRDRRA